MLISAKLLLSLDIYCTYVFINLASYSWWHSHLTQKQVTKVLKKISI